MKRARHLIPSWAIRWILPLAVLGAVIAIALMSRIYYDTMRDPVIQRLVIESDKLPPGSPPLTIAVLADIHVAGPDMPPSRVEQIVAQTNALAPDLVMVPGDLTSQKRITTRTYSPAEAVAPLLNIEAPLGIVFVPGNHDHWFDWPALASELARHDHFTVLVNDAAQIGPLGVGGVDDDYTGRANLAQTVERMEGLSGPRILLTHSPDVFPQVPLNVELTLAGHTHCGQVAYPWGGSPGTMSAYGEKYACGVVEEYGKTLVTSAGLGTSLLPIRFFTQPEIWLIEIRPEERPKEQSARPMRPAQR